MGFGPFFICTVEHGAMAALTSIIEPAVAGMGFELVDTQVSNHGRLMRIFIDKPGGITVDECADVSKKWRDGSSRSSGSISPASCMRSARQSSRARMSAAAAPVPGKCQWSFWTG